MSTEDPPREHDASQPDPETSEAPAADSPSVMVDLPADALPPIGWSAGPTTPSSPTPSLDDAPILPPEAAASSALQQAVGAPSKRAKQRAAIEPKRDDDDDDDDPTSPKRSRRTMIIASLSLVAGLGTAALVFLGRANTQRYLLTCDTSRVYAEQGRSFPPWGSRKLLGPEWAPIALPTNAECQPRESDSEAELGKWYLDMLVDRATVTLTARDLLDAVAVPAVPGATKPTINPLDTVAAQLDQALLLARDPDRRDQRKEIVRLQGDVEYWRATARLRDASAVLLDAAKQFDAANQQHPRHATDAAAWSTFLHHLADELKAGPNGASDLAPRTSSPTAPAVPVPVGTALPVETGSTSGSAEASPAPATVPSGGVLL